MKEASSRSGLTDTPRTLGIITFLPEIKAAVHNVYEWPPYGYPVNSLHALASLPNDLGQVPWSFCSVDAVDCAIEVGDKLPQEILLQGSFHRGVSSSEDGTPLHFRYREIGGSET